METSRPSPEHLSRLLGYLSAEPNNIPLLTDAVQLALSLGNYSLALSLLSADGAPNPLPDNLQHLLALAHLHSGDIQNADKEFSALAEKIPANAVIHNLAYTKALQKQYGNAERLLTDTVTDSIPEAAALKILALHHLARLDDALQFGDKWLASGKRNEAVVAALSSVALDAENIELARHYAEASAATAESQITLGFIELDDAPDQALERFESVIRQDSSRGRARLGQGLANLRLEHLQVAQPQLDEAAKLLQTHLGSWIAAGWAYLVDDQRDIARQRFETALKLDPRFAEAQGSLAVLDFLENRLDAAKEHAELALRLDRKCLSGILAQSLLLKASGNIERSNRIITETLKTTIGNSGFTIAGAVARRGVTTKR